MNSNIKSHFADKVRDYRLPRYRELPDMGLYLEQVTKYINGFLLPLGCPEITSSMISNYVKKGVISPPIKKQYFAEQIAYLIFISFGKSFLTIENITKLFEIQKSTYDVPTAYDYFCLELENMLMFVCGIKDSVDNIGVTNSEAKTIFRSVIIAVSHIIFLGNEFEELKKVE